MDIVDNNVPYLVKVKGVAAPNVDAPLFSIADIVRADLPVTRLTTAMSANSGKKNAEEPTAPYFAILA